MRQASNHKTHCNGHILLADDDPVMQMATARILEQAAYTVDVVNNGLEVINALKSSDYDLVLMDGSMPGMDGFEATVIIRSSNSGVRQPRIPIIALTGLSTEADRESCIRVGMNDHVTKPVKPGLLITAIERFLGSSTDENTAIQQQDTPEEQVWNDAFLDTIIDRFLEEVPQVILDLKTAIVAGDVAELERIGHRLKGPADLLGATGLSGHSNALQLAAKTGHINAASSCARELIGELQMLMNSITED